MTHDDTRWEGLATPLRALLSSALEHPALFESVQSHPTSLAMPCAPPVPRAEPLRAYRPHVRERLLDAAADGYVRAAEPLERMFAHIPPVLADAPFRLTVRFTRWERARTADVMLPTEVGTISAAIGGASFMATTPSALIWTLASFLSGHEGIEMDGPLEPWRFDVPDVADHLAEHVEPYQGLLADTARNAVARLASLSKPIRNFLSQGGEIVAERAERAEIGGSGAAGISGAAASAWPRETRDGRKILRA